MKTVVYRGLTQDEYKNIKELAKNEIPFRVNIRIHKQKYAQGAIDIRPYGKGVYKWTEEEFKIVLEFVKKHNLFFNKVNVKERVFYLCFGSGFDYTYITDSTNNDLEEDLVNIDTEVNSNETASDNYEVEENTIEEINQDNSNRETITEIKSNGSKSYGQLPDTIEDLLNVLESETLDPTFEDFGNFIHEYKPIRVTENNKYLLGCTSFSGNFRYYSHVFRVITNDKEIIEKLTTAIQKNQQTEEYKQAKIEYLAEKKLDELAEDKFINNEISLKERYEYGNKHSEKGKPLFEQIKLEILAVV